MLIGNRIRLPKMLMDHCNFFSNILKNQICPSFSTQSHVKKSSLWVLLMDLEWRWSFQTNNSSSILFLFENCTRKINKNIFIKQIHPLTLSSNSKEFIKLLLITYGNLDVNSLKTNKIKTYFYKFILYNIVKKFKCLNQMYLFIYIKQKTHTIYFL